MRDGASHDWPVFSNMSLAPDATAFFEIRVFEQDIADLPPSPRRRADARRGIFDQHAGTRRAVNETIAISGCALSAVPTGTVTVDQVENAGRHRARAGFRQK